MEEASEPRGFSFGFNSTLEYIQRRWQYSPWFIKISTLDRRLQMLLALSLPMLFIIIVIIAVSASASSQPDCVLSSQDYRGSYSKTERGLSCQKWSRLNSTVHKVTVDRYIGMGLGDHSYCRDPDNTGALWCYTSLTADHYDLCDLPKCVSDGKASAFTVDPRYLPNTDTSCIPEISVVNHGSQDGTYRMGKLWANGRGVYQKIGGFGASTFCISWHGQWRHWWITFCDRAGINSGFSWLVEDARCPDQGATWRRGGNDVLLPNARVFPVYLGKVNCVEYGQKYSGDEVADNNRQNATVNTVDECQRVCQDHPTCKGFSWHKRTSYCTLIHKVNNILPDNNFVSGSHVCQKKVRAGCPAGSEMVNGRCFLFRYSEDTVCREGCSRFRAMEECEELGGVLADSLSEDTTRELLELANADHNKNDWWISASDISKKDRFTWTTSDADLSLQAGDLWHAVFTPPDDPGDPRNLTSAAGGPVPIPEATTGNSHSCVIMARLASEYKLSKVNCEMAIAKPLCQFLTD